MENKEIVKALSGLVRTIMGVEASQVVLLPASGSERRYARLLLPDSTTLIGAYCPNVREAKAFIYLSEHFAQHKLPVPRIVGVSSCGRFYLQNDLGNETLFHMITNSTCSATANVEPFLKNALTALVHFQVQGVKGIDTQMLYPIPSFDLRSVMWDLNYFKYSYLKLLNTVIDEVELENDFERLAQFLLNDDMNYFQYRDFQSRNIMVQDGKLNFIDYQGGRIGPCLYDVASFLYQAKAGFSEQQRYHLLCHYIDTLAAHRPIDKEKMVARFDVVAAFRIMQTLGAYGYRGIFERKPHFIQSLPAAVANLKRLFMGGSLDFIPYIKGVVLAIDNEQELPKHVESDELTVHVSSISLKKGYPEANPEHGGGFVFDCRALPNPGRLDRYKSLTGLDAEVADYLRASDQTVAFLENVMGLLLPAVDTYKQRGFKYLSASFGCTGGQHRSVYCANYVASKLRAMQGVRVILTHRELDGIA